MILSIKKGFNNEEPCFVIIMFKLIAGMFFQVCSGTLPLFDIINDPSS